MTRAFSYVVLALLTLWAGQRMVCSDLEPASLPSVGGRYSSLYVAAGLRHGLDPRMLTAIAQVESRGNPRAIGRAGEIGLMQILPSTAAEACGVARAALFDPATNIDCGARYLFQLRTRYRGFGCARSTASLLSCYNAGPGRTLRAGGLALKSVPYVRKYWSVYQ